MPFQDLVWIALLYVTRCESRPSLQLLWRGLDEARTWLDTSETRGKEMYYKTALLLQILL